MSVASPTPKLLIAVINAPQQHLKAVWAIIRTCLSVVLCLVLWLQDVAERAANAFTELKEDIGASPARCEWCNHKWCCFHRLWQEFSADRKKEPRRGPVTIVTVTTGVVIIPQCIRMLSAGKLQQSSNHIKGKVSIEQMQGLFLLMSKIFIS